MAFGKWINNLKGLFEEGPMKELTCQQPCT